MSEEVTNNVTEVPNNCQTLCVKLCGGFGASYSKVHMYTNYVMRYGAEIQGLDQMHTLSSSTIA